MSTPVFSIILCTRDRASALRETLASLSALAVPEAGPVELVIVDNGSSDETAAVIEAFRPEALRVQAVAAPHPGKARALNRGLDRATGEILLFTDDDVRVPPDWVEGLTRPIRRDGADAVVGGVRLADTLNPATMTPQTRGLLAGTDGQIDPHRPARLVGANMAVHRRVFDRISGFDVALGPGGLGFEEDTLLGLQMMQAGMRVAGALDVVVAHCPDPNRTQRAALQSIVERIGRSDAYVAYHWRHERASRLRSWAALADVGLRLAVRRLFDRADEQGLPLWELRLRRRQGYHRQMLVERHAPRKYDRLGLNARTTAPAPA